MKTFKRSISIVLAVLMLLSVFAVMSSSVFAANGKTVTFKPGAAAEASPIWFAWTWDDSDPGHSVKGAGNSEAVTFDGVLENVIFVRMDNTYTKSEISEDEDWKMAWNKTKSLKTTEGNTFTFTGYEDGEEEGNKVSFMVGTWSTEDVQQETTETVVYGDGTKEGTYTATLDTGSYTGDGNWYVWTWTNKGAPGHFVKGTPSGNKIKFEGLCNRVDFATFDGEPDEETWSNRVAETGELKLMDGGTFTINDKVDGYDLGGTKTVKYYKGDWTGGTEVPEVAPIDSSNPSGHKEGQFTATVNAGDYVADGDWYAWTWTFGEMNGAFVKGVVSGKNVTFSGLNNRVVFATFDGEPDAETWSNRIAQTGEDAQKIKDGGTFTITGKTDGVDLGGKPQKDYHGAWSGGVDVPDVPEVDPDETTAVDIGEFSALLDPGAEKGAGDWYAWTWNDGGAPGHWIKGKDADGLVSFDELCNTVIFAAFKGEPLKDWSNRVGQTETLTVVDRATFTIDGSAPGKDSVGGKEMTVFSGSWGEPPEETTESVEETSEEETTASETDAATTEAPTTEATEATEAVTETETAAVTEATEATTETVEETTAPATEAASTAPVETKKYLFVPNDEQLNNADEFKLVVQDADNNIYTYDLTPTAAVVDGKVVYSADVPKDLNKISLQYQFYKNGKWIGQVVKSGEEIQDLDGKVVNGDGTIIDPNAPETTAAPETTVAPTTAAPTTVPETTQAVTTQPSTEKPVATEKKANTIKVTSKKKAVKAAALLKKKVTVKALKITDAKGTVKVVKVKKGSTAKLYSKIKVASKTGKITIKKGTYKKGTYKVKVKITAKGNKSYKSKTLKKTVKIVIK